MSDGYLRRDVAETDETTGEKKTRSYEVWGPISYVEPTTSNQRQDEDASRMVRITSDESIVQTQRVQQAIAADFMGASRRRRHKWNRWHRPLQAAYCLLRQEMLGDDPLDVLIPFANKIVDHFPQDQVKTRRLLPQIPTLLKTVALVRVRHHP